MCTVFGGESGRVAAALVAAEPIEVRSVQRHDENGAWVHDRRSGDRRVIAAVADVPLRRHETDELIGATLVAALESGICVLTGPQQPDVLGGEHYRHLTEGMRSNGVEVIADLSDDPLQGALRAGLDFCKVSDEDIEADSQIRSSDEPEPSFEQLIDGAGHAVITKADDPAVAMLNGRRFQVVAPRLKPVDHRGAGDALTALVAAARYWGLDWGEAVRWGAAAGALTVIRRGLATADRHEIHRLLDQIELQPIEDK